MRGILAIHTERNNMKILLINHFPLAGSGSGTYTKNLAVSLAGRGHDVTIILPENTEDYEEVPGVNLHPVFFAPEDGFSAPHDALPFNFPCFTTHPRSTMTFGDMSDEEMNLYTSAFLNAIDEEIAKGKPDVIHGQHVWILSSLAAEYDIPLVLTAHGTDLMGFDKWPDLRHFAKKAINASKAVITISKDNGDLVRERFPEASQKIILMRNGYDPGVFFPESLTREEVLGSYGLSPEDYTGKKIVIFAGKLTHAKGVDVLLRAEKKYSSEISDVLTLIVGDGEEMDHLKSLSQKLDNHTVRFLGNVDQNSLRRLYNISDVDIVPSRKEAFGLVALEAMACGIPVIATDQGGLPDFVNDSVGALVRPEDPNDLADAIIRTLSRLSDPTSAKNWRAEIHRYAREDFAQDTIIHELEDVYEKCCN